MKYKDKKISQSNTKLAKLKELAKTTDRIMDNIKPTPPSVVGVFLEHKFEDKHTTVFISRPATEWQVRQIVNQSMKRFSHTTTDELFFTKDKELVRTVALVILKDIPGRRKLLDDFRKSNIYLLK